jgi:hypothetical protein
MKSETEYARVVKVLLGDVYGTSSSYTDIYMLRSILCFRQTQFANMSVEYDTMMYR